MAFDSAQRLTGGKSGFTVCRMIVTATELASDSESVLDRVVEGGETIQVQRHGKIVAQISPTVGVSREELLRALRKLHWTEVESQELKGAMDAASAVFGYAGGD
jgi:antitoxin (DNA-binding transcriptional repressor) of toxin-antitoxin stability system